jgi:hypothetical protein
MPFISGSGNEEGSLFMQTIQTMVINVCFVNNVETSRFILDQIQYVDIMNFGIGDVQKGWYRGLHIIQGMEFDTCFGSAELSPPEDT